MKRAAAHTPSRSVMGWVWQNDHLVSIRALEKRYNTSIMRGLTDDVVRHSQLCTTHTHRPALPPTLTCHLSPSHSLPSLGSIQVAERLKNDGKNIVTPPLMVGRPLSSINLARVSLFLILPWLSTANLFSHTLLPSGICSPVHLPLALLTRLPVVLRQGSRWRRFGHSLVDGFNPLRASVRRWW